MSISGTFIINNDQRMWYKYKASNQSVLDSTTLVNDNDLVQTSLPSGTYVVDLKLIANVASSNQGVDIAWDLTNMSQVTKRHCKAFNDDEPLFYNSYNDIGDEVTYLVTTTIGYILIEESFIVSSTGNGSIQLKFAQHSANGFNAVVNYADSFMKIQKVD